MRLALLVAVMPATALASADGPSELMPPPPSMDRIAGPFSTANAYCARRERQLGNDADGDIAQRVSCTDVELEPDIAPRVRPGQEIRAVRFVTIEQATHVVVETASGWYGRELVSASNGDDGDIESVRLVDLVGDRDDEIEITTRHSHAPCGCDDLWHTVTTTYACTVRDGGLLCTDGTVTADNMHLVDIYSWSSELSITRDGRARRTITESENVSKRELRSLRAPFRLVFRR